MSKTKIEKQIVNVLALDADKIYVLFIPKDVLDETGMLHMNTLLQKENVKVIAIHCPVESHIDQVRAVAVSKEELAE